MMKNLIAASIVTIASVSGAIAATYPSFQFDAASSSIDLTQTSGYCLGSCDLSASFAGGATGLGAWTPTAADDSLRVDDFIDWSILSGGRSAGIKTYDVTATLAFSTPDAASGSADGNAGFGVFFGVISGGILTWDGPGSITFAQGSTLDFFLDGVAGIGNSATTGVTFQGNDIAPVPLPATALLLLSGIAGFGAMRRRKIAA